MGLRGSEEIDREEVCEDEGREWRDAFLNQGTLTIAEDHQKVGRKNERFSRRVFRKSTALLTP